MEATHTSESAARKKSGIILAPCSIRTYQEERIGQICIGEDPPSDPASCAFPAVEDGCNRNGENDTNKLVSAVGHQVVDLALAADVQQVSAQPQHHQLKQNDDAGVAEGDAQKLWLKLPIEACDQCRQQYVCDEGHERDIHVGRVDIFAGWEELDCALTVIASCLLPRPRSVSPGKEHDDELVDHVRVRDIEVVLQSRDVHVAVELDSTMSVTSII